MNYYTFDSLIEGNAVEVDASHGGFFRDCDVSLSKALKERHVLMSSFVRCRLDVTRDEASLGGGSNLLFRMYVQNPAKFIAVAMSALTRLVTPDAIVLSTPAMLFCTTRQEMW